MKHRLFLPLCIIVIFCTIFLCACNGEGDDIPEPGEKSLYWSSAFASLPDNLEPWLFDPIVPEYAEDGSIDGISFSAFNTSDGRYTVHTGLDGVFRSSEPAEAHGSTTVYPLGEGLTLTVEHEYTEYEITLTASLARDGKLLFTAEPAEFFGYQLSRDLNNLSGDVFRVMDACLLPAEGDREAQVLLLTPKGVVSLREDGSRYWINSVFQDPVGITAVHPLSSDGTPADETVLLYLAADRNGNQVFSVLDPETGKSVSNPAMPEEVSAGEYRTPKLFMGNGYALYVCTPAVLWGLDLVTDAENGYVCRAERIIDFAQSAIDGGNVYELTVLTPDCIALIASETYTTGEVYAAVMRRVPTEEIPQKTELQLASFTGGTFPALVVENRYSETVRWVVKDYSVYGERAKDVFDAELAAGYRPDAYLLPAVSNGETLAEIYQDAGFLADLVPDFAGTGYARDDLLGYLTKPFTDKTGAQYLFPVACSPCVNLTNGAYGISCIPTLEEALASAEALAAEGISYLAPRWSGIAVNGDNVLTHLMDAGIGSFADTETAVCSFTDGRYASIVSRCASLPAFPGPESGNRAEDLIREGKAAVTTMYTVNSVFYYIQEKVKLGGAALPVSYPNDEGLLYADGYNAATFFAVSSQTEHPSEAMALLGRFITLNETLNRKSSDYYSAPRFPLFRSSVEEICKAIYAGKTVIEYNRTVRCVDDADAEGEPGNHYKITDADIDEFISILDSIDRYVRTDTDLFNIWYEEQYSEVPRTPAETAKLIQSKTEIYLSENQKLR